MILRENVSLKELTTFKAGGDVRYVAECHSTAELKEALLFAKEKNVPWYVLGEGSNMIPEEKGFDGLVIRIRNTEISFEKKSDTENIVTADAGVSFDVLVEETTERGLWGLENLAGIPGTVGAAPVQNIGAYGAEIADVLLYVDVFDTALMHERRMSAEECAFSYRESVFKTTPHYCILRMACLLRTDSSPNISYPDLIAEKEKGTMLSSPFAIADAIRAIRAQKFPDWKVEGTAGSFFKNPILSEETYQKLQTTYGTIPSYAAAQGIKIPLAFVLDKILGLRGYAIGSARLFERQPLVLTLLSNGNANDIETLARFVEEKVFAETGITIEREPRTFGK